MAANYTANLKNTMPKINFPKFPKFPNGGGSWQLAPAGAGSIAVAVEGAGVAEGVIGLGNGGFSGFPDMGSLGLGLKMMQDSESSGSSDTESNIDNIFKINTNLKLTEGLQRKIFDYLGKNADEIIDLGLADEDVLKNMLKNLKQGTKEGKEGFLFEAKTIKLLIDNKIPVTEAGKTYDVKKLNGRIGEIDIATSDYIIECYNSAGGRSKKGMDFLKYFEGDVRQPYINPNNKKVIVYSPNGIDSAKANTIREKGVIVITNEDELIKILKGGK